MAGEGFPSGSSDEPQGRVGGDDANVVPFLAKDPQEGARLVGGDASRDPEKDAGGQLKSSSPVPA